MSAAVLVISSGSSSIKFAMFAANGTAVGDRLYHGLIEGIGVRPKLKVKNGAGETLADFPLAEGAKHADALQALLDWMNSNVQGLKIVGIGHRVVFSRALRDNLITPERLSNSSFSAKASTHSPSRFSRKLNGLPLPSTEYSPDAASC